MHIGFTGRIDLKIGMEIALDVVSKNIHFCKISIFSSKFDPISNYIFFIRINFIKLKFVLLLRIS